MARPPVNRLAASIILTLLVVGAHVVPGFSTSDLLAELRNGAHFVGFAAIAWILYPLIRLPRALRVLLILLIVATLGVISEFTQSRFQHVDLADVARDLAGSSIMLVAILLWSWSGRIRRGAVVVRGLAIVTGLAVVAPLAYWSAVYASYVRQFPVIVDFDGPADYLIYRSGDASFSTVDAATAGDGFVGQVLSATLLGRNRSTIVLQLPLNDWSDYRWLSFRIAITGDSPTRFDVHLNDGFHPGYRTRHRIGDSSAGSDPVTVRFPLEDAEAIPGRPDLDTATIYEIYLIARGSQPDAVLYLDDVRLE